MRRQRGYTLIATMMTIAIIMILTVVWFTGGFGGSVAENTGTAPRKDGLGQTVPGLARVQAQDEVCKNNLKQVRQGLQIASMTTGEKAVSIEEARIGQQFYECPLGREKYEYNPETGEVRCPHPGHEKY